MSKILSGRKNFFEQFWEWLMGLSRYLINYLLMVIPTF